MLQADLRANAWNGPLLTSPGCEAGCSTCHRQCAVTRIVLDWWQRELASLGDLTTPEVITSAPATNVLPFDRSVA